MRILVLSDIHGDLHSAMRAVNAHPEAGYVIFCGDGIREFRYLKDTLKNKNVVGVSGNCDFGSTLPLTETLEICGKRIFVTHGHIYQAKFTTYKLVCAAREEGADIVLFGHTHSALNDYDDGLYIMNPGHCSGYNATYGLIDITENGDIVTNIVKINNK